ncbi:MAG: glycosyltransferase family 4 protein [Acidobacteria bacterium]|nr:glycosyltransferase family 4 protein [Acidobacteriota bacterium]
MHSQSWIDLFEDDNEFDVRVFAHNLVVEGTYLPQKWKKPTYVLQHPRIHRENRKIIALFPDSKYAKFFSDRIIHRAPLNDWYLRRVIGKWKPDIVHSLSMLPVSYFTWRALSKLKTNRPLFVTSSWGTDINLGKDHAEDKPQIKEVLSNCDGFIADCERDIGNALNLGLPEKNLAFDFAVPVTGGIDVYKNTDGLPVEKRNVILLPKAYEGFENKFLPVLEALNSLRDKLEGFEVHLLMTSEDVKRYLSLMPEAFKKYCRVHTQLRKNEVLDLMKRARIMVSPSFSDGTPMTLLEAMSVGTLPVVSPLESIKEWIEDGKNGLLARALYPDEIARAVDRALSDDELFNSASIINREIIRKRANRQQIQSQVINYYKHLPDTKKKN